MAVFPSGPRPSPQLVAQAAKNPGGWVCEIDTDFVDDPDGYVPPEAVRGAWQVGQDGRLTGKYEANASFGPPRDDFTKLTEPDSWLGWLGEDPADALRDSVADTLTSQVPGALLEWMKVVDRPRFLTGGRRQPDDERRITVTRCGVAVPFALSVRAPDQTRSVLWGVFTWCADHLDRPGERRDQVWLDLRADLDWAEEQLRGRLYAVGTST